MRPKFRRGPPDGPYFGPQAESQAANFTAAFSYSFRSFFISLMFEGFSKIESGMVLLYSINS